MVVLQLFKKFYKQIYIVMPLLAALSKFMVSLVRDILILFSHNGAKHLLVVVAQSY